MASIEHLAGLSTIAAAAMCPSDAAAFMTPALKPKPDYHDSAEEAEAAGWTFNATTTRWEMPAAHVAQVKELEQRLKGLDLTDARVDAMGLLELRRAFNAIRDGDNPPPPPGSGTPVMFDPRVALRARLKEYSREMARTARLMRKNKSLEPMTRLKWGDVTASERTAHSTSHIVRSCKTCGKEPPAGCQLLSCGKCMSMWYCNKACQSIDWPQHKASCRIAVAAREEAATDGVDLTKLPALQRWYATVPDLGEKVACLAWQLRAQTPFIVVQGGINARLAQVVALPQRLWWRLEDPADADDVRGYVNQADFRPDVHYVVKMSAGHAGTETWPGSTARMKFPLPPEQMDAWVKESVEGREALQRHEKRSEAAAQTARSGSGFGSGSAATRVRVTGLRSAGAAHLNGQQGVRGTWDAQKVRFEVRLDSGEGVRVKPENLQSIETTNVNSDGGGG
mmetsp:Transcript_38310/g.95047  ORF Transcript_38310/g.95047 Transcript_38310/m.95047 type:complete len:452 (+) Transcript_38310:39-1394(+)